MDRYFVAGVLLGVAIAVIWRNLRQPIGTPPKKSAAQPVGSNILGLDEQLEGTG